MEKQDEIFQRVVEAGPDWESRESAILEKLGKKVDILVNAKKLVESISNEQTPDEVKNIFNKIFEDAKLQFPEDVRKEIDMCLSLDAKIKELQVEFDKWMPDDINDSDESDSSEDSGVSSKYDFLSAEIDTLSEEMWGKINGNEDVFFLLEFFGLIKSLIEKNSLIHGFNGDKNEAIKSGLKKLGGGEAVAVDDVLDVVVSPFSISFVIKKDVYSVHVGSDSAGMHIRGSLLNFIKENSNKSELQYTINHEDVHNMLDGLEASRGLSISPEDTLVKRLERFTVGVNSGDFQSDAFIQEREKQKFLAFGATEAIDILHEELVAAMERATAKGFKGYYKVGSGAKLASAISSKFDLKEHLFIEKASSLSTAGRSLYRYLKIIEKYKTKIDDVDIVNHLKILKKTIIDRFTKIIETVIDAKFVGSLLSTEAQNRVDILLHILKPSGYRHIIPYLKHEYGEEKVSFMLVITNTNHENFSVNNLKQINVLLSANPEFYDLVDWDVVMKEFNSSLELEYFGTLGIDVLSIESLREYIKEAKQFMLFAKVADHLKYSIESVIESATRNFFYTGLAQGEKNQFTSIEKLYDSLNDSEKAIFKDELVNHFEQGYVSDAIDSVDGIKKSALWTLVKKMGIEDIVTPFLEQD